MYQIIIQREYIFYTYKQENGMKEYQLWFNKKFIDSEFETFEEAICCPFEFCAGTKNSQKFVHLNRAFRWERYTWNSVFGILFYSETNIDVVGATVTTKILSQRRATKTSFDQSFSNIHRIYITINSYNTFTLTIMGINLPCLNKKKKNIRNLKK